MRLSRLCMKRPSIFRSHRSLGFILLASLSLIFAACSQDSGSTFLTSIAPTPTSPAPTSGGQPTVTPVDAPSDPILLGRQVFVSAGCSVCHGEDATGTGIAPGLPGHSATQVRRQVRAPLGTMPLFPPDKISGDELEALAAYIESLQGGHGHVRSGDAGESLVLHHWMSLFALEAGDADEAQHHIGHIIEVTEGQHLARMEEARMVVSEGDSHGAAHIVETMLAGLDATVLDESTMHLKLALSSMRIDDAGTAGHHLEHYVSLTSNAARDSGQGILDLVRQGDLQDAEHELEELLGEPGHPADDQEDEEDHDGDARNDEHDEAKGEEHAD